MLTKLIVRNFKRFDEVEIDLGSPVVFIGPNDSGKSTALQALALWDIGHRRWLEKRRGKAAPEKRPGVTINRRDLVSVPVPEANLLWRDLRVREVSHTTGVQQTRNVLIDVLVEGTSGSDEWACGFEFDYANDESFYCRPLRTTSDGELTRMPVPPAADSTVVSFLPPMSGLADREFVKQEGEVGFLIGQGRTAEVLRNLCYQLRPANASDQRWADLCTRISDLFGVALLEPRFVAERSEITLSFRTRSGVELDLSSGGRGFHQTLLLLAYLAANPNTVLLLDEPDAHLEILRQRQVYRVLTEAAAEHRCQIIAASHSEVVLNEAAAKDVVVAFVVRPHRIDGRGSQVLKSLRDIGFDQYYQAEQRGWVLYLEGSTDLAVLQAFARTLQHPAGAVLDSPFLFTVQNQPQRARDHFHGLRGAKPDLVGIAVFDRLSETLRSAELRELMWARREIENYLCSKATLLAWAAAQAAAMAPGPLFAGPEVERWRGVLTECIEDRVPRAALRDPADPWWNNTKASDDFLDPLFEGLYTKLGLPRLTRKSGYHALAPYVPASEIDPQISEVLDAICAVAARARVA